MFTSGFFNSVNSDRRYNADQMSAIFDGLITQGIFDSIGDHFQVKPGSGLTVTVGTGRAWLNQTWSYNDSLYPLQLSAASPTLGRKDLVCLKVDKTTAVRANSLVLIEGTPASTPTEPTVTDDTTNGVYYHKLAAVTVPAGATSISAANIQNYIGLSTGTPYVTGLVSTTAVDELWSQWDGEFNDWWENSIKPIINAETVTRLQNNIDHITPKETTMNLYGFSHLDPPPSGKTYQEYSTDAILNQISTLLNQKVPTSRTVNGKALTSDIAISADDISAYKKPTWITLGTYGISRTANPGVIIGYADQYKHLIYDTTITAFKYIVSNYTLYYDGTLQDRICLGTPATPLIEGARDAFSYPIDLIIPTETKYTYPIDSSYTAGYQNYRCTTSRAITVSLFVKENSGGSNPPIIVHAPTTIIGDGYTVTCYFTLQYTTDPVIR